jgi:hexosaminidase
VISDERWCLGYAAVHIHDEPLAKYRGILIDMGRAYFSVKFLESIIDGISWLGMNALHWHMTDDQSFPIEILAYPELHKQGQTGWE